MKHLSIVDLSRGGKLILPTYADVLSFPTAASSEGVLLYAELEGNVYISNGVSWLALYSSGYFTQGGNSFGTAATIGTNDNFDFSLERNNITMFTLKSGVINLPLLTGASSRIVEVSTAGDVSASIVTINGYLTTGAVTTNLENTANWDIIGVYTGPAITGTFQGQKHYNADYMFECVADNVWIRLIRG